MNESLPTGEVKKIEVEHDLSDKFRRDVLKEAEQAQWPIRDVIALSHLIEVNKASLDLRGIILLRKDDPRNTSTDGLYERIRSFREIAEGKPVDETPLKTFFSSATIAGKAAHAVSHYNACRASEYLQAISI